MIEKSNKRKKCSVSGDDVSTLLRRYTATTVLALLQEVAQAPDVKIDWNELVKKTTTGITNAREYQMVWRHLAYRHGLVDRLDDGAVPLDDDSDLECELESSPAVTSEASAEAAACVKVLIASGMPGDSYLSNGTAIEAPLTINVPTGRTCRDPLDNSYQGTNITVPICVQIQPLPNVASAEGLDTNGSSNPNLPPRRKRKPWSEAEDLELIAAVQKCGEGNWANILKGDFKSDRTASQLSQRWAIIRKRQGTSVGNSSHLSSHLTEAQLAARRAMSLALDMPIGDNLKAACSINNAGRSTNVAPGSNPANPPAAETSFTGTQSPHHLGQQDSATVAQKSGTQGPSKPRVPLKKPTAKSTLSPDSMVKAAAVAAGARIATPSDAASLLKAAQSKNAVHIKPGGGPLVKSSVVSGANALPSNVHFIRTGLVSHSNTMQNATRTGPQPVQSHSAKPASSVVHSNAAVTASGPKASTEVSNNTNSTPAAVLETKTIEKATTSGPKASTEVPIETKSTPSTEPDVKPAENSVKESRAPGPCNATGGDETAISKKPAGENTKQTCSTRDASNENRQGGQASTATVCVQEQMHPSSMTGTAAVECSANDRNQAEVECTSTKDNDTIISTVESIVKETNEKQTADRNQTDPSSMAVDGANEEVT